MTTDATMDLTSYDRIVLSTSGGKDSQVQTDYVYKLAASQGVTDRLVCVHADLGRAEWKGTWQLAERQAQAYGIRFEVISRPQGDLMSQVRERGKWPSSDCRYCTSDHKRDQISKVITMLDRELRAEGKKTTRILDCQGLRAEESPARKNCTQCKGVGKVNDKGRKPAKTYKGTLRTCPKCGGDGKRLELDTNERRSTKTRTVDTWLPILHWTLSQVWATIKHSGVEHHHAYDLGMPRLSCVFCIFAPRAALIIAGKHNPELLNEYCQIEEDIAHTFKNGFKIAEIRDAIEQGEEVSASDGNWNM